MENLTHSLVGATLAELALPGGASRAQRRTFFITGVLAANLPDADLLYTRITPAPLGSLLHHRGHTHTIGGLVALALLFGAAALVPVVQRTIAPVRARWWALVVVALVSHLVLDSWNSYGVHPFWPFDSRWIYGDAIFIADPWLWLLLGVSVALNMQQRRAGALLGAGLVVIVAVAAWRRVVPVVAAGALVASAVVMVLVMLHWAPRRRAASALALTALYVAAMFGVRSRIRERVISAQRPAPSARVIDLVLSPEPANPLCWSMLLLAADETAGSLVTTAGTTSAVGTSGCGKRASAQAWDQPARQALAALRDRYRRDCWTRAWLQFGRAPELQPYAIGDSRYGGADGGFTTMLLRPPSEHACPAHLTPWTPPRSDLLEGPPS
ncbi:MAG TPA: metal-dependent hydrolase [Gemmatimonadaceae bacterium]|nr:metal-dependent hydrolase [Gemmatimonadaceae bacterium]